MAPSRRLRRNPATGKKKGRQKCVALFPDGHGPLPQAPSRPDGERLGVTVVVSGVSDGPHTQARLHRHLWSRTRSPR